MDRGIDVILQVANFALESVLGEKLKKIKQAKDKEKFSRDILRDVDEGIKESFEKEKIKEFLMRKEFEYGKSVLLYDDDEKKLFVESFFDKNPELRYLHSEALLNVLYQCMDKVNKIINEILTPEGQLIISTIKKETDENGERITKKIEQSTTEITKKLDEFISSQEEDKSVEDMAAKQCPGYSVRYGLCTNSVFGRTEELCVECLKAKFTDEIINLYKIQNYFVTKQKDSFVFNQSLGMLKIQGIAFTFYVEESKSIDENIYKLLESVSEIAGSNRYQFIHIISNVSFEDKHKKIFDKYNVCIYTEETIINQIMDFDYYLRNIVEEYEENELNNHYIDIYDENTERPIEDTIFEFTNSTDDNALFVLGDYGSGKTSFMLNLAYRLAKSYLKGGNPYIPLYIPLKDYSKAINFENLFKNFFTEKCNIPNPTIKAFSLLLQHRKFVILFDGFDEVAKRVNYDVKFEIFNEICKYGIGNTKIIVTCRPNYFQEKREYKKLVDSVYLHLDPKSKSLVFKETYIKEFCEEQIFDYINSFADDLNKLHLTPQKVEQFINNTHDLMDLAKRPFLLSIIMKTLPKLIQELNEKGNDLDNIKINAAILYEKYVDSWLDRENLKGKTLIRKEDKLLFCRHIAYKLFVEDKHYLHFSKFPDEIRRYFKNLSNIEEIDYFSHDIQSCSFMSADGLGNFKFIHKSFMEYFVATMICDSLQKEKSITVDFLNKALDMPSISSEIALFINDLFDKHSFKSRVFSELESKMDLVDYKVRENIITILTKNRDDSSSVIENDSSYINSDFSFAIIRNRIIENVNFSKATFYNATFENVKFVNCFFEEAYFQKAILKHVDFSNHNLDCVDLSYCEITNCRFMNSSLANSRMFHAKVINNDFENCDMSGICVEGAFFYNNYFEDAIGLPYEMR